MSPVVNSALSGGITGSLLGGASALLNPATTRKALLKAILSGGATGAAIGGGTQAIGSGLMGEPGEDEPSGYTRRAALGGALGGGALGGIGGYLVGKGKLEVPKALPSFVAEYAKRLKSMPSGGKIGAALGALALGAGAGYLGADEGMQLDFIKNEMRDKRRRKLEELYGSEL